MTATSLCQTVGHCTTDGDAGLFIQDFVDGVGTGASGGNTSAQPVPPGSTILLSGTGASPQIATAMLYVSSDVANVTIDIRQPDGTIVTDSCPPVEGVVAFAASEPDDFVSDARALDKSGATIGTVGVRPPGRSNGTTG